MQVLRYRKARREKEAARIKAEEDRKAQGLGVGPGLRKRNTAETRAVLLGEGEGGDSDEPASNDD